MKAVIVRVQEREKRRETSPIRRIWRSRQRVRKNEALNAMQDLLDWRNEGKGEGPLASPSFGFL